MKREMKAKTKTGPFQAKPLSYFPTSSDRLSDKTVRHERRQVAGRHLMTKSR